MFNLRKYLSRSGLTFRQLVVRTLNHVLTQHEPFTRASAIAFSAMMAFVPFLALLITICAHLLPDLSHHTGVGFANITVEQVETVLKALFPNEAYRIVEDQIVRIQASPPAAVLSVSLVFTIWGASGLFLEVMGALNRIYGVTESRSWWRLRLIAILMTLVQCFILLSSFVAIVAWPQIMGLFGLSDGLAWIATGAKLLLVVGLILGSFAIIFRFGPNADQKKRWVTPGAVFGTVVFIAACYGFRYYVQHFKHYETAYGSLGGVMMLLLWFWIMSLVLLIAAEMNKLAEVASRGRK